MVWVFRFRDRSDITSDNNHLAIAVGAVHIGLTFYL
ncbi:MAG: hypothetical protein ACK5WL_03805 [Pseudanabaena sp.]